MTRGLVLIVALAACVLSTAGAHQKNWGLSWITLIEFFWSPLSHSCHCSCSSEPPEFCGGSSGSLFDPTEARCPNFKAHGRDIESRLLSSPFAELILRAATQRPREKGDPSAASREHGRRRVARPHRSSG
jgi:hypothetical protein